MTDETEEIDNPCYHCYTGAIGECYGAGCRYVSYPWSGDLEEDYKVEVKKYMDFEEQIKILSDIASEKNIVAQDAVDEVSKLMHSKYPELDAEYSVSDGGIIFINDSTMTEYYNIEQIYQDLGRR